MVFHQTVSPHSALLLRHCLRQKGDLAAPACLEAEAIAVAVMGVWIAPVLMNSANGCYIACRQAILNARAVEEGMRVAHWVVTFVFGTGLI